MTLSDHYALYYIMQIRMKMLSAAKMNSMHGHDSSPLYAGLRNGLVWHIHTSMHNTLATPAVAPAACSNQIKNQIEIYIAPYVHADSEALGG